MCCVEGELQEKRAHAGFMRAGDVADGVELFCYSPVCVRWVGYVVTKSGAYGGVMVGFAGG